MVSLPRPARPGSVAVAGLLLAGLFSGTDLVRPTTAAAQAIGQQQALLGRFEPVYTATVAGSGRVTAPQAGVPTADRALLGKVEAGDVADRSRADGIARRAFADPARGTGEEVLLGRRGRLIS